MDPTLAVSYPLYTKETDGLDVQSRLVYSADTQQKL